MLPDHDNCLIYFPTILHYGFGKGNSLNTEYTQCKKLKQALVTKTATKVKDRLAASDVDDDEKVDLVLVTHGSADSTKIGGGSWLYTPVHEAQAVAKKLVADIGGDNLEKTNIWLWICQAGMSGSGAAFRREIPTSTVKKVYAPGKDIEGVGLFLQHLNVPGSDSFTLMR